MDKNDIDLTGKVAVITGGGGGIGAEREAAVNSAAKAK